MAISAVVAVGQAGDALVARLRDRVHALKVGPSMAEGMDMGPLITSAHRDKVRGYIEAGVKEGATLVVDGRTRPITEGGAGFFLGPSLFDRVTSSMSIYTDEIFGPVLVVLRAETLDEAIGLVNRNPYGNGTAIFTSSGAAARRFETEIEVGMVGVNVAIPVPMAFFSFGGWKQSLFGDLHMYGLEGVYFYTRTKAITARWPRQDAGSAGFMMPTLG
jgi:malonate-semialdehyde dehydrogenase (acetylating)/methylmalonate-semialdehyde dehydrogenase